MEGVQSNRVGSNRSPFGRGGDFPLDHVQRIERAHWILIRRDCIRLRIPMDRAVFRRSGTAGFDLPRGVVLVEVPELEGEMDEAADVTSGKAIAPLNPGHNMLN